MTTTPLHDLLSKNDTDSMAEVGVFFSDISRSGTFVQFDDSPLCAVTEVEGMEVISIADALKKYDWLREKYFWKLISPDQDEVTARCAEQEVPQGYFVWVKEGVKATLPCQAALYMATDDTRQVLHNVMILEDDSELTLITGCVSGHAAVSGTHYAVSETFIGKNASFTNTMVHSWGPEVIVLPRAGIVVDDGGSFFSNYVSLRPAKYIESNPKTWLNGKNSSAKYQTIIFGAEGSTVQTGGHVYLNGEGSRAEFAHRGVCTGGHMNQLGTLYGNAAGCKGHIDCAGLLLDPKEDGYIVSQPGLEARHPGAQLSHEASIGKIAADQVEYLQSRGLAEHEAISLIIRGFLDADIEGLGSELDARISEIVELAGHGEG